jgi:L-threonylcarbamoyladenylate synthase
VLPLRRPLLAGAGTSLAVRVPAHLLLRLLLARVGPLTATSANRAGEPPAATPDAVRATFGSGLDLLLDGGNTVGSVSSTLLDCTGAEAVVLRAGAWSIPPGWPVKTA